MHVQVNQIDCEKSVFTFCHFAVYSTFSDIKLSNRDFPFVLFKTWLRRDWQDLQRISTEQPQNDRCIRDFNIRLLASLFKIFSIMDITNERFFFFLIRDFLVTHLPQTWGFIFHSWYLDLLCTKRMLSSLQSETSFPVGGAGWRFLLWEVPSASWPLCPTDGLDCSSPNSNPEREFPTHWSGGYLQSHNPNPISTSPGGLRYLFAGGLPQAAWLRVTCLLALSWSFYHQFKTEIRKSPVLNPARY